VSRVSDCFDDLSTCRLHHYTEKESDVVKIGLIGGSGFDDPDFITDIQQVKRGTPYGPLSSDLILGKAGDVDVVMLSRHGAGHRIRPSAVNFRANIHAMKEEGVTHIIATTACGSLREDIEPGHLVFPDQFIDRTHLRKSTFHEGDQVVHIAMADPFCERLRQILIMTASEAGIVHHPLGTVVTIEGPRFSTRAESKMFRMWGGDIVNMSTVPEVVLAREAGICYSAIAMSTDYDAWHESKEPVTWDLIVRTMQHNVENVKKIFFQALPKIDYDACDCRTARDTAKV
jgi:5'-methylthioadenosine phosphorylase